jgi:hypothetical protein
VSFYTPQQELVLAKQVYNDFFILFSFLKTHHLFFPIKKGWFCLEEEKKWIIQLMVECRDMHIADEKVSLAMKQSSADDAASSNSSKSQTTQLQPTQQSKDTSGLVSLISLSYLKLNSILIVCMKKTRSSMIQIQANTSDDGASRAQQVYRRVVSNVFRLVHGHLALGQHVLTRRLTINATYLTLNLKSSQQLALLVKEITRKKTPDEFYSLVGTILITFSDIVRAAFIPHTFETTTTTTANADDAANDDNNTNSGSSNKNLFLPWPIQHVAKIISQILPHCLRSCR